MAVKNLKAKITNENELTVNFTISRSDYEIRIYLHEDFYSITGVRHGTKRTYFSKDNKIKDFNNFYDLAKFINKRIVRDNNDEVINIVALAINKANIINDDTLNLFVRNLSTKINIHELSAKIVVIEKSNQGNDNIPPSVYPRSGSVVGATFSGITPGGAMLGTGTFFKQQAIPTPEPVLTKSQKLSIILTDIETIEVLLNKVKESARRLQAEIMEESK